MKKLILASFILLLQFSLFSQDEMVENQFDKSISVNFKYVDFQSNLETYDELSSSFGIDLQGSYHYKINSRLELKTGIELSYLSSRINDYTLLFPCDISFNRINTKQSFIQTTMDWFYFNVPIEVQFNIFNDEKRIYIKGGVDNLFHLFGSSRALLYECGNSPRDISGLTFEAKPFFGQVNFGVGIELNIRNEKRVFIEPSIEYAFSKVIDIPTAFGEKAKSNFLSFGVQTGIRF